MKEPNRRKKFLADWLSGLNWQSFENLAVRVAEVNGYQGTKKEGGSNKGPDAVYDINNELVYFEFTKQKDGTESKIKGDIDKVNDYLQEENEYADRIDKLVYITNQNINQGLAKDVDAPYEIEILDRTDVIDSMEILDEWFTERSLDQIARFDSKPDSNFKCWSERRTIVLPSDNLMKITDPPEDFNYDIYLSHEGLLTLLTELDPSLLGDVLYSVDNRNFKAMTGQPNIKRVNGPETYVPIISIDGENSRILILSFTDQGQSSEMSYS
ncbi:hypothetical protein [Natronorubrum sp. A-ect3]|uniref:hypothetical protein n=1 Tax=Natronorubrum sp. A-ect3 TaxID=3242698 RepID=UPI00359E4AE5